MRPRTRSAIRLALFLLAVYTVFGIFLTGYRVFTVLADGDVLKQGEFLGTAIQEMSAAYGLALLFPLVLLFVRRYPFLPGVWLRRLPAYVALTLVFAFVHTSFMGKSREILFPLFGLGPYDYGIKLLRLPMEFFFQTIHLVTVIGFIHFFLYYQWTRDREVRAARLETQLQRAKLENLQAQLHPHFLFNTLNAISSLMYHDVGAADRLMTRLSDLLRITFGRSSAAEVTLNEELHWLDSYLSIMQERFGDRLNVRRDVDEAALVFMVPTLILQPLVENAIRHGVANRAAGGTIEIIAKPANGALRIEVRDDGPGLPGGHMAADEGNGVGLSNTAARLLHMYGEKHQLTLSNGESGGTVVVIEIPARQRSAGAETRDGPA